MLQAALSIAPVPVCNGIGTQHAISREAGLAAINDFCGTGVLLNSNFKSKYTQEYGAGTDNWVRLGISYGSALQLDNTDCKASLTAILDQCDVPGVDSPANMKHGGVIHPPKLLSMEFTPLGGNPVL